MAHALDKSTGVDRLVAAIRRITVDAKDDRGLAIPNGPAEFAMLDVESARDSGDWEAMDAALARLFTALANNCQELREAAEKHFGGDFRARAPAHPRPCTACLGGAQQSLCDVCEGTGHMVAAPWVRS